jgi:DnaJ-class molecular chaperone with C-terminal Zn finger domain
MLIGELKRKLRQLKKLETQIRFKNLQLTQCEHYIWDGYFSTKDECDDSVKYNMKSLLEMDHENLKEVFDEYLIYAYFQYYKENGIAHEGMYDVGLLSIMGLPPDSSIETIKSKFRELAKKYHPDLGGDSNKFIELVDIYRKLIGDE